MRRISAAAAIVLTAAGLLVGCGSREAVSGVAAPDPSSQSQVAAGARLSPGANAQGHDVPSPGATIADRGGPSWSGGLGDTVQVDWYVQSSGKTVSEQIAVLRVKRVAPSQPGGPYDWRYGIKVRLTSLSKLTARVPAAYQFLSLSDGAHIENGISGIGIKGGPDPSRVGTSSVGWLYQNAEKGFEPTEIVLPISAWEARWSLE
ncbi:MAG TPA: hypothetical protein VFH61_16705 [Thermoleophilia bacterium]|nr:hypothetical protein [Thermoleophilia bacterium]